MNWPFKYHQYTFSFLEKIYILRDRSSNILKCEDIPSPLPLVALVHCFFYLVSQLFLSSTVTVVTSLVSGSPGFVVLVIPVVLDTLLNCTGTFLDARIEDNARSVLDLT